MPIVKPKATSLFNEEIDPACCICENSNPISGIKNKLQCSKNGVVGCYHHCNKFIYAPLKREIKRRPSLPTFSLEDFKL